MEEGADCTPSLANPGEVCEEYEAFRRWRAANAKLRVALQKVLLEMAHAAGNDSF